MSWKRARRLVEQLERLVQEKEISWEHQPNRPNRVEAWSGAIEQMIASPPKRLPITNHNYLRRIAYEIADELDKQKERRKEADITRNRRMEISEEQAAKNLRHVKEIRQKLKDGFKS